MKSDTVMEKSKYPMKNPYYEKLNMEVTVAIRRSDYKVFEDVANQNGETPESVMRRCLKTAAKNLLEHD